MCLLYVALNKPANSGSDMVVYNRRNVIAGMAATAVIPWTSLRAQTAFGLPEMILGDPNASIEIIEYASMTCPACANFHNNVLPQLKSAYLDTGKARLIVRDFPLDRLALDVSVIARCESSKWFFAFIEAAFASQRSWLHADDPVSELKDLVRMGGRDPGLVDACLADEEIRDNILAMALDARDTYKINSTPSFVINGEYIKGLSTFEAFDAFLRDLAPT